MCALHYDVHCDLFVTPAAFPLSVRWQLVLFGSCHRGRELQAVLWGALLVPSSSSSWPCFWCARKPSGRAAMPVWYCSHLKPPDFIRSPLLEVNSKHTDFLILCVSALFRCQLCLFGSWHMGTLPSRRGFLPSSVLNHLLGPWDVTAFCGNSSFELFETHI